MYRIWHSEISQLFVTFKIWFEKKIWFEFKNIEVQSKSQKFINRVSINVHIFEDYFSPRTEY